MEEKAKLQVDMLNGSIMKGMVLFMIPLFFSYAFQMLYNTVDTMIVGNVLGESSMAAMGSASTIYDLLISFCMGIGNGMSVVTARAYGKGDRELLKRSVFTALMLVVAVSLILTILAAFGCTGMLKLINTPENVLDQSEAYLSTITLFLFVTMMYNLVSGLLRSIGNSFIPLCCLILSSGINVVLDIFFIVKMGMGVEGAAIATVIAQTISVILCLIYVLTRVKILVPEKKHIGFDKSLITEMLEQGLAMAFMNSIVNMGTVILQSGINSMGEYVIAGHVAARKIFQLTCIIYFSMSQACVTFTSQNFGAGNALRIRKMLKMIIISASVVAACLTVVLYPVIPRLIMWLSGSENETLITNAVNYLRVSTPCSCIMCMVICTRMVLQGLNVKLLPIVSSITELCGKCLFTAIFIPIYGYAAVIVCEPIIWCVMFAQLIITFYRNPFIKSAKK